MADFSLNSEPVKYALIALATPIWLPFLRALWKELNDSLRDEGGVLGMPPSKKELAKMDRELGAHENTMLSVTWAEHSAANERRRANPGARASGARSVRRGRGLR